MGAEWDYLGGSLKGAGETMGSQWDFLGGKNHVAVNGAFCARIYARRLGFGSRLGQAASCLFFVVAAGVWSYTGSFGLPQAPWGSPWGLVGLLGAPIGAPTGRLERLGAPRRPQQ